MKRFVRPLDSSGFTITEAMVVVTLVAIMTGFSYSGFSSLIVRERARSAANQYASYLKEARIRSIEKHMFHTVVYSYGANEYNLFSDGVPSFTHNDPNFLFEPDRGEIEIAKVQTDKEFKGVIGINPGIKAGTELKISFDVRGFPLLEDFTEHPNWHNDSILFLSQHANPSTSGCLDNDCCKNVPSCGDHLCCAVCVSYAGIKVTCNHDY